jgi:hypothetical protein
VFNFSFEVDHISPRASGGRHALQNTALACESCNLYKSDSTEGWDETARRIAPLYHPRRDTWSEHFRYEPDTGEIVGLSDTGRVTVALLRFNSGYQVRARRHWIRLDLYP